MPRANGITRQQILTSIKRQGSVTAEELAREMSISQVAVRQHLASLEAEGAVCVSIERRGLGRPSHRYAITTAGDELFPRRYEALANGLLDVLSDQQGDGAVIQLFDGLRERAQKDLAPRLREKSLFARTGELARYQSENGFMAEVEEDTNGVVRLTEYNCSLCAVARRHTRACCGSELALYQEMLPDAEITREKFMMDGDHTCTFRIEPRP